MQKHLELIRQFVRWRKYVKDGDSVFFHGLEDVERSPVMREERIVELCRGRRVAHFGFADAPFTAEKARAGELLHQRIDEVAESVYGLDVDEAAIEIYREVTGDERNGVLDVQVRAPLYPELEDSFDVVVFGETLEHLKNPGIALENLHALCEANPGCELCVTVPNAFSVMSFIAATNGNELVHPDHYSYYSPVTLRNLLQAHGFGDVQISLYSYNPAALAAPGITSSGVIAIARL